MDRITMTTMTKADELEVALEEFEKAKDFADRYLNYTTLELLDRARQRLERARKAAQDEQAAQDEHEDYEVYGKLERAGDECW